MGDDGGKHPGGKRFGWAILLALLLIASISSQESLALAQEPSKGLISAPSSAEGGGASADSSLTREVEKTALAVPKSVPVPRPSGHRLWPKLGSMIASEPTGAGPVPTTPGASGWWLGSAGIALALAICGAVCIAARKHWSSESAGLLQVIGRVSLSPRQSIVLVRVGKRVLLIGTGAQGSPSLLGELPADENDGPSSAEQTGTNPAARLRPARELDARLGEAP